MDGSAPPRGAPPRALSMALRAASAAAAAAAHAAAGPGGGAAAGGAATPPRDAGSMLARCELESMKSRDLS